MTVAASLVTDDLIQKVAAWLGEQGRDFFRTVKKDHGQIDAIFREEHSPIPHVVHFREGMLVRNKLRELTNYSWTDHQYDELWAPIVEAAIA